LRAREDLRRELAAGLSLNDIRRRYKKPTVAGDDVSPAAPAPAPPAQSAQPAQPAPAAAPRQSTWSAPPAPAGPRTDLFKGTVTRASWDLRALVLRPQEPLSGAGAAPAALTPLQSYCARGEAREAHSLQSLAGFSLLSELVDSGSAVLLTADAGQPLTLHWSASRTGSDDWLLPPACSWPAGSVACGPTLPAVDTPFVSIAHQGAALQQLRIPLDSTSAMTGIHFVLRSTDGSSWYKNGEANFRVTNAAGAASQPVHESLGALAAQVIGVEGGNGWWSLWHRYNLARSLLPAVLSGADPEPQLAQMLVWLRYSSQRHLTWQRNYNVQPRQLSASQADLGLALASAYVRYPRHRELLRAMLATMGRGGDGGAGQKIRDEILNIMHRRDIKEVSGTWMEEWHQKLHNNTTPDDIVICDAYLAFLRGNGDLGAYWRVLEAGGVSRERLASFERPIRQEPTFAGQANELIADFQGYQRILKSVHAGADLEVCLRVMGSRLPQAVGRAIDLVRRAGSASAAVVEGCAEARQELHASMLSGAGSPSDAGLVREALFLDVALEDVARRAVERAQHTADAEQLMRMVGWAAEHAALSSVGRNEHMVLALLQWRRVQAIPQASDPSWALRAQAAADRLRAALAADADSAAGAMQPFAEALGAAAAVPPHAVALFSEEVIRGGSGFALSLSLSRFDPVLRAAADLGAWAVISPVNATGTLRLVPDLSAVQSTVYQEATVLLAERVGGGEEIPQGAVAVLTPSTIDVLSHSAVRARNTGACFATCYDGEVLSALRALEGKRVALTVRRGGLSFAEAEPGAVAAGGGGASAAASGDSGKGILGGLFSAGGSARPKELPAARFAGKYAVPLSAFAAGLVGGKSRNTRALRERLAAGALPADVALPASCAVPFGSFEAALEDPMNRAAKAQLAQAVRDIDVSSQGAAEETLAACRAAARLVAAPPALRAQLLAEMGAAGMDALPVEEQRWGAAFSALTQVWASKFNVRAYLSLRQAHLSHDSLRMAVLVQRIVPAAYAFVLHTTNPADGDASTLYGELVAGLGETLVGNYPGRALAFTARKPGAPQEAAPVISVLGFPSKTLALRVPPSFIFRSDSNGEDLEGYAGAGLYDSVPVEAAVEELVDYSVLPLVWDDAFRTQLLTRIAQAGIAVEAALGSPQDIEGCVDGEGRIHLVQTRPQV